MLFPWTESARSPGTISSWPRPPAGPKKDRLNCTPGPTTQPANLQGTPVLYGSDPSLHLSPGLFDRLGLPALQSDVCYPSQELSTKALHRLPYILPSSTSPVLPVLLPQLPGVDHVLCYVKEFPCFGEIPKYLKVKRHHICNLL